MHGGVPQVVRMCIFFSTPFADNRSFAERVTKIVHLIKYEVYNLWASPSKTPVDDLIWKKVYTHSGGRALGRALARPACRSSCPWLSCLRSVSNRRRRSAPCAGSRCRGSHHDHEVDVPAHERLRRNVCLKYDTREPIEARVLPNHIEVFSLPSADRSITIANLREYRAVSRRHRNRLYFLVTLSIPRPFVGPQNVFWIISMPYACDSPRGTNRREWHGEASSQDVNRWRSRGIGTSDPITWGVCGGTGKSSQGGWVGIRYMPIPSSRLSGCSHEEEGGPRNPMDCPRVSHVVPCPMRTIHQRH